MLTKVLLPALKGAQKEPTKVACIGTRSLPEGGAEFCEKVGSYLVGHGVFIGSGNADGADAAYLRGVNKVAPWKGVLYLPWKGFNSAYVKAGNHVRCEPYPEAYRDIVRSLHANPARLSEKAWKLMIRNVAILEKSAICVAWPGSTGGTKFGIKLAESMAIPVIDLSDESVRDDLTSFMETWL